MLYSRMQYLFIECVIGMKNKADMTYQELQEAAQTEHQALEQSRSRIQQVGHKTQTQWRHINGRWVKVHTKL